MLFGTNRCGSLRNIWKWHWMKTLELENKMDTELLLVSPSKY